jgi:hypothetical protein
MLQPGLNFFHSFQVLVSLEEIQMNFVISSNLTENLTKISTIPNLRAI